MKILAIDPGPEQSGYVVWYDDHIVKKGKIDNHSVLDVLMNHSRCHVVIEMIASYGMPAGKSLFETAFWIGRFYQYGCYSSIVDRVFRKDVKMWLCGSTRAKDGNVRQALIDRYGKPGTKKTPNHIYDDADKGNKMSGDIWAALAVATYWQESDGGKKE